MINPRFIATTRNPKLQKNLKKINEDILNNYQKIPIIYKLGIQFDGVLLPLQFPVKYFHTNISFLKQFSRTMLFKFTKEKEVKIKPYD